MKEGLVESRINSFILNEDQNEVDINALTDFYLGKKRIYLHPIQQQTI